MHLEDRLTSTLLRQSGVITRRQVRALGAADADIQRMLRRRAWAQVHEGVYVTHTGTLSWDQRAWAAVLVHPRAALDGAAALRSHGVTPAEPAVIDLAVPPQSRLLDPDGVRSRRTSAFATVAQQHRSPPRVRVEHAALTAASSARSDEEAAAVLGAACQLGHTTPRRLSDALAARTRLPRRALLRELLAATAEGVRSPLELRYLRDVERAHGLPRAERQANARSGHRSVYRDVEYTDFGLIVELDGRMGHADVRDRWADLDRDLSAAAQGHHTLRITWPQVLQPCRTARAVAVILTARGWQGGPRPCGPACGVT